VNEYFLALQTDDPSLLPSNLDGAMTPMELNIARPPITPFDASIAEGKVLVFEELAKSRAVPSHRDSTGTSVLHDIFANPCATAHHVNMLCKHMDPNTLEHPSMDKPIHYAAFHATSCANSVEMLKALVNQPGIDVNTQNSDGQTAAHVLAGVACDSNLVLEAAHDANVITLIDKAGADFSIKANDGRSAIDMLRGTKAARRDEVAAIIAKHDKQDLISRLGTAWKPSDCKDDGNTQQQEQRPQKARRMI
jgi:hypothetical protein